MDAKIQSATVAALKAATAAVAVAIETSVNGVDAAELPAIIAHCEHAKREIDRIVLIATEQANRKSWNDLADGAAV